MSTLESLVFKTIVFWYSSNGNAYIEYFFKNRPFKFSAKNTSLLAFPGLPRSRWSSDLLRFAEKLLWRWTYGLDGEVYFCQLWQQWEFFPAVLPCAGPIKDVILAPMFGFHGGMYYAILFQ